MTGNFSDVAPGLYVLEDNMNHFFLIIMGMCIVCKCFLIVIGICLLKLRKVDWVINFNKMYMYK